MKGASRITVYVVQILPRCLNEDQAVRLITS